ncbi:hypothetical protein GCM10010994_53120 [Chelatococcus reniformis]|uniref:Uncharacterized protein n=1 Tax=Chelatococcus reniformis TaxID=1494448 RepID=A0A916UUJ3_9HYPH|nr:hypothetical protein GCM10010994_53120 [Chelatococcus reniformis]
MQNVVQFTPGNVETYRHQIADLGAALRSIDDDRTRQEVFGTVRALVDRIVIRPGQPYKPVTSRSMGNWPAYSVHPTRRRRCHQLQLRGRRTRESPAAWAAGLA